MKLLFMELRKQADRKFLVVLVLIFAFAFGISLNGAKKYNNQVSSLNEMSLYNAQISVISATENAQSEKDADRAAYYEEEAAAYSELVTAYENKDVPAVISATLRESNNEVSSNKAGIILDDESFNRAKKNVDICSILVKKGIKFYHSPYMEESYCDGAQAVTSFLQEYLFLLLPIVMMLLFADCLATEIRMGSIKLPLGLPYSRTRFLWNKYIAGALLGMVALFVAGFGAFLGGTVVAGTGDIRYPILAEKSFFSVGKEIYIAEWRAGRSRIILRPAVFCSICPFHWSAYPEWHFFAGFWNHTCSRGSICHAKKSDDIRRSKWIFTVPSIFIDRWGCGRFGKSISENFFISGRLSWSGVFCIVQYDGGENGLFRNRVLYPADFVVCGFLLACGCHFPKKGCALK